ncbi:alkylation response protein AidB-like acyl-CoA dehydrogenase [Nocardia tenerifensis]|uniref:Alkylation response protein AidB-like acyl-CoA dehydrogenase n=2 Tax=Nocardia tenerifensis TaxID=228006 RepID=A0A318K5E8_9NOCA|nr:acyl-CoA dehydrogenase [Nocardia tenerifensis]PXX67041.1 alkylation response protein AidB-like acyl-CoA dehydrogenase [Nocardia tenerifensis]
MTIATTDEHKAVQESMRGWAGSVRPIATMRADPSAFWRAYWPALADLGIFRVAVAEDAGGAGGTVADLAVLVEQAAHDLVGGPVLATALANLITAGGLDERTPCGVALDFMVGARVSVATEAKELTLDGDWDSVVGATPETAVLLPVSFPQGRRWVLLAPDTEGLRVEPLSPADLSTPLARVHCAGVRVPADRIFTSPHAVEDLVVVLAAAELAGLAGWCLSTAVEYAKVREQFGRKIGSFQAVKHICAWMLCRTELIRAVAADAAAAVDEGGAELPVAAAIAAAIALDAAVETAKDCVQVLGGIGFTWEHDAHLYLRRATALRQLLGGSARWRARVTELTRAGKRRTTGADRVFAAEGVAVDDGSVDELAAEVARIAALPADQQRAALVDAGLAMPHWPPPYGRGADPMTGLLISEELRRAGVAAPDLAIGGWAVPTLLQHGTQEQIDRFAWPTLRGEVVWCQLFSEPEAGSDLAALRTTAKKVDGGWVLRGQKVWTSLGDKANWGICLARTDPDAPKHRGISYFLVDMHSAGLEVRPLVQITGEARFSEVFLDDVFVPDDCVVGALHNGWKIARSTLSTERVAMGGNGIGPVLEELIAKSPAEGPGAELVNDRLGGFVAEAIGGLLLEQRAAVKMLAGGDPGAQSSVRKLVGVRHRQAVAEFAVETAGPAGAQDSEVVKEFLLTRCLSIAGGTEQILLTVAGERILGLPRDTNG